MSNINKENFKCPTCDGYIPNNENIGAYSGALSRRDNKTEICSKCGNKEALEDLVASKLGTTSDDPFFKSHFPDYSLTMKTTNEYDIHYVYEAGYDEAPKIWAFELYKDKNGDWNCQSDDIVDRYDFTEEDIQWIFDTLHQSDGSPYTELSEFWIDDWFNSSEPSLRDVIPPKAVEWLNNLKPYEYHDERD